MTEEAIILLTIQQTLDRLGINPPTYKSLVTKNHAVKVLGIGRHTLDVQILKGTIRAEFNGSQWEVDKEDVIKYVNRKLQFESSR